MQSPGTGAGIIMFWSGPKGQYKGMVLMSTSTYIMLLTLFLTEGGTLEAEQEISAATLQECRIEAQKQQAALRREFALSVEERGMCPFRDVQITCVRKKGGR